jgi:uncharacterized protein (DUF2249 family)
MSQSGTVSAERTIGAREIEPRFRHTAIFQLFEHLDAASSLQLIATVEQRAKRSSDRSI